MHTSALVSFELHDASRWIPFLLTVTSRNFNFFCIVLDFGNELIIEMNTQNDCQKLFLLFLCLCESDQCSDDVEGDEIDWPELWLTSYRKMESRSHETQQEKTEAENLDFVWMK